MILTALKPLSASGTPIPDGVERSYAAIFDGHNGCRAADVRPCRNTCTHTHAHAHAHTLGLPTCLPAGHLPACHMCTCMHCPAF